MITIEKLWLSYKKVIPEDAPAVQFEECRRAFYAGVHGILMLQRDYLSFLSDGEGVKMLEGWHQECVEFANSL